MTRRLQGVLTWIADRMAPRASRGRGPRAPRPWVEALEPRLLYAADPLGASATLAGAVEWRSVEAAAADPVALRTELVVVDAGVHGLDTWLPAWLATRTGEGVRHELLVVDDTQDGLVQVADRLQGRHDIAAVHLLAHGTPGGLLLGGRQVDAEGLEAAADTLARWSGALTADADILVYGCDVASGEVGQAFVQRLAELTATDVAASDDRTGAAALGGDWALEVRRGPVEAQALSMPESAGWQGTLGSYVVSNLNDSGAGSLRAALLNANTAGGPDAISFSVTGTIHLSSALPEIVDTVSIDGTASGAPGVVLNGGGTVGIGLYLRAGSDGSTVRGLVIQGFTAQGIKVENAAHVTVAGNYIGTTGNGTAAAGNLIGIDLWNASHATIGGTSDADRNVISGNGNIGLNILGGLSGSPDLQITVQGNFIGTTASGLGDLGNTWHGIYADHVSGLTIGGTAAGAGNLISGNGTAAGAHGITLQADAQNNTIAGNRIGLNQTGQATLANTGAGILVFGSYNTIGGSSSAARNVISGNAMNGIRITGTAAVQNTVAGNLIGTNTAGTVALGNVEDGIQLDSGASFNLVGGLTEGARNLVAGNGNAGVAVDDAASTGNQLLGNWIGLAGDGGSALGNQHNGINVNGATGTIIGNGSAGGRNLVASSGLNGIGLSQATGTVIAGNWIVDNALDGVVLTGGATAWNRIGGSDTASANLIAYNGADGITLWPGVTAANAATILANHIFANGDRGIDLGDNGYDTNDPGDADTGANGLQNYPLLTSAVSTTAGTTVTGGLNSSANTSYRIDFYTNRPGDLDGSHGEGARWLGATTVTTDGSGQALINANLAEAWVNHGDRVTATATRDLGGGSWGGTSEYATNVVATASGVVVVDTQAETLDGTVSSITHLGSNRGADGRISLAEAMAAVNATANGATADRIVFAIPPYIESGSYATAILPPTITLSTALTTMTQPVFIDARTQPGYAGTPLVQLRGNGAVGSGIVLAAGSTGSTVRGLVIGNFTTAGIEITGGNTHTIAGNWIGLGTDGVTTDANGRGIVLGPSTGTTIGGTDSADRNVISGNAGEQLYLDGAVNSVIYGNYIGPDASGTLDVDGYSYTSGRSGLAITGASSGNQIGNTLAGALNVISGNNWMGVDIVGTGAVNNTVSGNYIGTDASGQLALGNAAGVGYWAAGSGNRTVANVISGNVSAGVAVGSASTGATIQGNAIGLAADGSTPLGNATEGVVIYGASTGSVIGTDADGSNDAAEANLISGNATGIAISDAGTTGTTIKGNRIGTDHTGSLARGNAGDGIVVTSGASGVTIGGTTAVEGNLISGNAGDGLWLDGADVTVVGNVIGLDGAGTAALANGGHGIDVTAAGIGTTVGGAAAGAGNVISGNGLSGVLFESGSSGSIQGNRFGTNAAGNATVAGHGAALEIASSAVQIGGTAAGQGNVVTGADTHGIVVSGSAAGVAILGNAIYGNAGLGIDLMGEGVTANDGAPDADGGPNGLQNFPVLTSARTDGSSVVMLAVNLTSAPSTAYRIEFFADSAADASGHGEGRSLLGHAQVTTDAAGVASFSIAMAASVPAGHVISATATRSTAGFSSFSDTSEFSAAITASSAPLLGGTGLLAYAENQAATPVHTGLTVSDLDNATLASATVQITGGYVAGEDLLAFTNTGMGNIAAGWNAGTGTLALSSAGGTATLAQWQAALRAVTYVNSAGSPATAARTVSFTVHDGVQASNTVTSTVTVTAVNDAPAVDLDGPGSLSADGAETRVNTTTLGDQGLQVSGGAVATDADGNSVVVWSGAGSGDAAGVFGQRYDPHGTPLGGEFRINATVVGDQGEASVAMTAGGDFVVVWSGRGPGDNAGIFGQRFDSNGSAVGGEFRINSTDNPASEFVPSVAIDDSGAFVVVWQDSFWDNLYAQRFDAAGVAQGGEILVVAGEGSPFAPGVDVGIDGAGGFVVVWGSWGSGADDEGIYLRRYDAAGQALAAQQQVNQNSVWAQEDPSLAMRADGSFVVVWTSLWQDAEGTGVYGRRYDGNGLALGNEFRVNTEQNDDQGSASVAITADDGFVVTWVSGTPGTTAVQAQRFAADGSRLNDEFTVRPANGTLAAGPSVAAGPGGKVVIVWDSEPQDGSGSGVYQQRFTSAEAVDHGVAFTEDGGAVLLADADAAISDLDGGTLDGLTVSLTNLQDGAAESLSATTTGTAISASYHSGSGVLTLSGVDTLAHYQQVLRTVAYDNSAQSPGSTARVVAIVAHDGITAGPAATATVFVSPVNDAPLLDNTGTMQLSGITEDQVSNSGNTVAEIIASAGGDRITDADAGALEGLALRAAAVVSGAGVWQYSVDGGTNWLDVGAVSNGSALLLRASDRLRFVPDGSQPASASLGFRAWDQTEGSAGARVGTAGSGGTSAFSSAIETATITVSDVADAPTLTAVEGSALSFVENGAAAPVTASLVLADADSATLAGATVQIVNHYAPGEDLLAFSAQNGISGSWNGSTGTLTLSGSATVAAYEAALRSVTYQNISEAPSTALRTVSFSADDGVLTGAAATRDIAVTAVNDVPQTTAPASFAVDEDGSLLLAGLSISDPDAGSDLLRHEITVSSGSLAATGTGSVTVSGSGSAALVLVGTLADLNAYLASASTQPVFSPAPGASGSVVLQARTADGRSTGSGGVVDAGFWDYRFHDAAPPGSDPDLIPATGGVSGVTATLSPDDLGQLHSGSNTSLGLIFSGVIDTVQPGSYSLELQADDAAKLYLGGQAVAEAWFGTDTQAVTLGAGRHVLELRLAQDAATGVLALRIAGPDTGGVPTALTSLPGAGRLVGPAATRSVTVVAVNDAPSASIVPTDYAATEQLALLLSGTGLSVADEDAGSAVIQASLSVADGWLDALAGSTGVVITGSGSGSLGLQGTVAQINALLAGTGGATLHFTHDSDVPPATTTLTLQVDDLGHGGAGGALTASDSATIAITAVNDPPLWLRPLHASVIPGQTLVFEHLHYLGIGVGDPDVGTGLLQMQLSATGGTLTLASLTGLSFTLGDGDHDAALTVSGTLADLNAALDGLSYDPTPGFTGDDSLSLQLSDLGGTGSGGPQGSAATVPIHVGPGTFLQGHYLEVGLDQLGTLGSDGPAPAGFHSAGQLLGAESDPQRDGWARYDGDFINPGAPVEEWGLRIGGVTYRNGSTGTADIGGAAAAVVDDGQVQSVTWTGGTAGLAVTQNFLLARDDLHLDMVVTLTNTSGAAMTDLYYYRHVDPDNNHDQNGSFDTVNTIVGQGDIGGVAWVSATQPDGSAMALMGLGTQARVALGGFGDIEPADAWAGVNGHQGSGTDTVDLGITLVFRIAALADGESVTLNARYLFGGDPAPRVDLDGNDSTAAGTAMAASFTEGSGPVAIADLDATLGDDDSATLTQLTVTLTATPDGAAEWLAADISGTAITASYAGGILTLSGSDSVAHYQQVLRSLTYDNTSQNPDASPRLITVVADDGLHTSAAATATVSVVPVNDEPLLDPVLGLTVAENSLDNPLTAGHLHATDADHSAVQLLYTLTALPAHGVLFLGSQALALGQGFTQADIDAGLLRYAHDGSETASDSFGFSLGDGVAAARSGSLAIAVQPVNDHDPVIAGAITGVTAAFTVDENSTAVTTVAATDADRPGQTLVFSLAGPDAAHFVLDPAGGALRFAAAPDREAPADADGDNVYRLQLLVSDGQGRSGLQTLAVTVADVDEAPAITSLVLAVAEGGSVVADALQFGVADGDSLDRDLLWTITGVQHGRFERVADPGLAVTAFSHAEVLAGQVRFVHDGGEAAPAFEARVSDARSTTAARPGEIVYTPVNDAPVLALPVPDTTGVEGQAWAWTVPAPSFTDADIGDTLAYAASGLPAWLGFDALTRTFSGTPGQADAGAVDITLRATDRAGAWAEDRFTLTVTGADAPPQGLPLIVGTAREDETLSVDTRGLSDPDGLGPFALQWMRDGVDIAGATGPQLTLGDAEVGRTIAVRVAYVDGGGMPTVLNSLATDAVAGVNDAPAIDHRTLVTWPTMTEDDPASPGWRVADGLATAAAALPAGVLPVSDADAGAQGGVVIVGLEAGRGRWEFSVDGGGHWQDLGAVSDAAGLHLGLEDRLRFVPDGLNGSTPALVWRAWDRSNALAPGARAAVEAVGGSSAYSATASRAALTVTSLNDAPVIGDGTGSAWRTLEGNTDVLTPDAAHDVDEPGDRLSWALVGGADVARFAIDARSGQLQLREPAETEPSPDAGAATVYELVVEVEDGAGGTARQTLRVRVAAAAAAPAPAPALPDLGAVLGLAAPGAGAAQRPPGEAAAGETIPLPTPDAGSGSAASDAGSASAARPDGPAEGDDSAGTPGRAARATAALDARDEIDAGRQALAQRASTGAAGADSDGAGASPGGSAGPSAPLVLLPGQVPVTEAQAVSLDLAASLIAGWAEAADSGQSVANLLGRSWGLAGRGGGGDGESSVEDVFSSRRGAPAGRGEQLLLEITQPRRVAGVSLTAGFVWWLTRGGGMLATVLMSVPAWRHMDLLPVMARSDEDEDDEPPRRPDDADEDAAVTAGDAAARAQAQADEDLVGALFDDDGAGQGESLPAVTDRP